MNRAWLTTCKQRTRDAENGNERAPVTRPEQPDSEPERDDADVLHRGVRQQSLEVVLGQSEEDAPDPGDDSHSDQQPAPPRGCGGKIGQRADEAVDPDLDHRAGHDGGDVARSCGVSLRKPDVQRHEPGLGAEADHREQKQDTAGGAGAGEAAMAAKSSEPAGPASKTKKASRKAVPRCVATRYVRPASRTCSSSSSNVTRK